MSELVPKRPLVSLTKEECQTLFALAFGYAPPLEHLRTLSGAGPLSITDFDKAIHLLPDGQIQATWDSGTSPVYFNARKLITQLDAFNVAFGDDTGSVAQR